MKVKQTENIKAQKQVAKFLQSITNDLDFGEKIEGAPHHVNCKDLMIRFLEGRACFLYPKRLTQKALCQHFANERTLYFTGSRGDFSLVYIDPDCHKSGTKEGAFQFLEYLKDKYFPNLYYEASTHGNGGSGYIIVDRSICSDRDFNGLLKQLDRFLKKVLASTSFDVEDIEVKGAVPELEWNPKFRGVIDNIKCGGLAKFPREMRWRADEFMATTRLTTDELQELVNSPVPEPIVEPAQVEKRKPSGSFSGKHIDTERIQQYLPYAEQIMGSQQHQVGNKTAATALDCAIFLTLLEFFTQHPNEDGTLPSRRFKALWEAMYECGDISRAFDNKRFAYLRNLLSDLGLIEWKDNTYLPAGGKAMKWHGSSELMNNLEELRSSNTNTSPLRVILCGKWLDALKVKMENQPPIRPKKVNPIVLNWYDCVPELEERMRRRKAAA